MSFPLLSMHAVFMPGNGPFLAKGAKPVTAARRRPISCRNGCRVVLISRGGCQPRVPPSSFPEFVFVFSELSDYGFDAKASIKFIARDKIDAKRYGIKSQIQASELIVLEKNPIVDKFRKRNEG